MTPVDVEVVVVFCNSDTDGDCCVTVDDAVEVPPPVLTAHASLLPANNFSIYMLK